MLLLVSAALLALAPHPDYALQGSATGPAPSSDGAMSGEEACENHHLTLSQ